MISLLLTLGGLVLLALDRALSKERVAKFDEELVNFCRNFGPLGMNVYGPAIIVAIALGFLWFAPFIQARVLHTAWQHTPPNDAMLFITGHPTLIILLAWLAIGPAFFLLRLARIVKTYLVRRFGAAGRGPIEPPTVSKSHVLSERDREQESETNNILDKGLFFNLIVVPIVGIFFFPTMGLIGIVHVALIPFVYPLKPLLLFNGRIFTSFSGVVGLIAAITGALLQFHGC